MNTETRKIVTRRRPVRSPEEARKAVANAGENVLCCVIVTMAMASSLLLLGA